MFGQFFSRESGVILTQNALSSQQKRFWFHSMAVCWLVQCLALCRAISANHIHEVTPGVVVESVECRLPMRKAVNLIPSRNKPMTFKMYTCHCLFWWLALIGEDKDSLALCGILGHDGSSLVSQLCINIKSSWVCAVIILYPSWYDLRCC